MMETAESYRAHWSTVTGKPEREIYVPLALRKRSDETELIRQGLIDDEHGRER